MHEVKAYLQEVELPGSGPALASPGHRSDDGNVGEGPEGHEGEEEGGNPAGGEEHGDEGQPRVQVRSVATPAGAMLFFNLCESHSDSTCTHALNQNLRSRVQNLTPFPPFLPCTAATPSHGAMRLLVRLGLRDAMAIDSAVLTLPVPSAPAGGQAKGNRLYRLVLHAPLGASVFLSSNAKLQVAEPSHTFSTMMQDCGWIKGLIGVDEQYGDAGSCRILTLCVLLCCDVARWATPHRCGRPRWRVRASVAAWPRRPAPTAPCPQDSTGCSSAAWSRYHSPWTQKDPMKLGHGQTLRPVTARGLD